MQFKYSQGQSVKFTYKGCEFTGIIQGIKEGTEPLYWIWVKDKYGWVRESLIKEMAWILNIRTQRVAGYLPPIIHEYILICIFLISNY